jgi:MFS family permease
MSFAERRLTMVMLCLSGSIIYWLFGFSKTQIGLLSSVYGVVSLLTYVPGGWLADRYSPRKLMSIALATTGLSGLIFAMLPSFKVCLFLFGMWGVTTACIFWSALIKATRNCGSEEEQGRVFGFLEGGRNFVDMITATILLAIFAFAGGDDQALASQILICAALSLILAVFVWVVMKEESGRQAVAHTEQDTFTLAKVSEVLKLPIVWLMAIIIMSAYSGYWGATYFTPYATEIFDLGSVLGGAVGTAKLWIAALAAVVAGFIADRIGPARAVLWSFILMTFGFLIFALLPGKPSLLPLLLINVAAIASAVYALRGIYYSLLEQGGIPIAVTGTATGVISVIGYTPDIFVPPLGGLILDANPGVQGYQNLFLFITALSAVGLIAAFIVYRRLQCNSLLSDHLRN